MPTNFESKAHTPPYKIHKYFARRPYNLFEYLISKYTKENDVIFDPFMGGGVSVYEGVRLKRRACGVDYNPLSPFIVEGMLITELPENYQEVSNKITNELGEVYLKYFSMDGIVPEWFELTFVVICNSCKQKTQLSNVNKVRNGVYQCAHCKETVTPHKSKRVATEYLSYAKNGKTVNFSKKKPFEKGINFLKGKVTNKDLQQVKAKIPDDWDRQSEDKLSDKGIVEYKDFFTAKNLYLSLYLKKLIDTHRKDEKVYRILRLIFSSALRDTSIMSFTSDGWQSGKPATWSKHAFWIPSQFCELNVLTSFKRAEARFKSSVNFNKDAEIKAIKKAKLSELLKAKQGFYIQQGNSSKLKLNESVFDIVLTDPPYGSNVQYRELSSYWNVWNSDVYDYKVDLNSEEAVVNRKLKSKTSKNYEHYENLLMDVFTNAYKGLKLNGLMVLTFNNKDIRSWVSLLKAIFNAGFEIRSDLIFFQEGVKNYRQTSHTKSEGTFYGDFVLFFQKLEKKRVNKTSKLSLKDSLIDEFAMKKKKFKVELDYLDIYKIILPVLWNHLQSHKTNSKELYEIFEKDFIDKL